MPSALEPYRGESIVMHVTGTEPHQTASHENAIPNHDLAELFRTDAASEYDARHLYARLLLRAAEFSPAFRAFLDRWRADEERHYLGLRRLLAWATDMSEAEVDAEMSARPVSFEGIEPFLVDEFSLLVTFAYDERVTVQAYAVDYPVYDSLGPGPARWVRQTNRDEARHYRDALALLKTHHRDRLPDARDVLTRLVAHDERRDPYGATFLLDHDDGAIYFTAARLRRCAEIVARRLGLDPLDWGTEGAQSSPSGEATR